MKQENLTDAVSISSVYMVDDGNWDKALTVDLLAFIENGKNCLYN